MGWHLAIAAFFGASSGLDAYWIGLALPKAIADSLHFGILTFVFTLTFHLAQTEEERRELVASLLNLVLLLTLVSMMGLTLGAPVLVRWMGPGLAAEQRDSSSQMMMALSLLLLPTAFTGAVAGILHAQQKFLPFALARVAGPAAQMVVLALLVARLQEQALVWATVSGAACMLAVCLPGALRIGLPFCVTMRFHGANGRAALGVFLALAGFSLLERLNQISDRFFASLLEAGSVSVLEFGWRFEIPISQVLGLAVALPTFATMAVEARQGRLFNVGRTVAVSARLVALLVVPVACFLVTLREPITALWFLRGAFRDETSSLVSSLIPALAGIFVLRSFGSILVLGLLAIGKIRLLLGVLALEVAANTCLNAILSPLFGLQGIVVATALAMLASNLWLWLAFVRRLEGWSWRRLLESVRNALLATGCSCLLLQAAYHAIGYFWPVAVANRAVGVVAFGLFHALCHFYICRAFGQLDAELRRGIPRVRLTDSKCGSERRRARRASG